ncbi:glycine zipper family protein [Bacillus sp. DNRA2]|nr:glycine zipper family protein [Bacillus sp. DNRA2]
MNQWLALGLIFGAAFSYFNLYAISLGLLLGIGIGAMLDSDAKKKGKQI